MARNDNSVRNKVFVGVAVGAILLAIRYFAPSAWEATKAITVNVTAWLWSVLTFHVTLPAWTLVFIAAAIPAVVLVIKAINNARRPPWFDYTQDTFRGMVWRWRYSSFGGGCCEVWCYCPNDDATLVFSPQRSYNGAKVQFICESCGREFGPFPGTQSYVVAAVTREIERKIRTGEWRDVVGAGTDET